MLTFNLFVLFFKFKGIREHFTKFLDKWKDYFDSLEPHNYVLPDDWNQRLDSLQKLNILRCLRPDKIVTAIQLFVMGKLILFILV